MTVTFSQSAGLASANSSSTRTLTTVNAGASLAIECMYAIGGESVVPTASGVTFTLAQSKTMASTTMGTRWYVAHAVPAGTVITFTPSSLMKWAVDMWEVLGGDGTLSTSDSVTDDTISASSAAASPGLTVPDGAGVLAMFHCDRNPTATAPTSFTLGTQIVTDENPHYNLTYSRVYSGAASNQRATLAAQGSAMHYSAALLVFPAGTPPAPTITGPSGAAVTAPSTANFSASVSGTYTGLRWQRQAAGAGAWADVVGGTGGTTTSYTTGATSVSGGSFNSTDKIRLAVDWSGGTVTSNEVTLTVTAGGTAPGFTVQPANQSSTVGSTATFGFTVSGSGSLTVQAKKNGTNVGSPFAVTAGVSANYTTPALLIEDNGATYAFEATGDTNPAATSNAVTLTVLQPLATTFSFTLNSGNSLTGLKYAVFDQATPDLWAAPIKQAANGSSNGSGVVTIDVTGLTARRIGEKGSAILTNSDGTDTGGSQAATRKLAYYVGAFS